MVRNKLQKIMDLINIFKKKLRKNIKLGNFNKTIFLFIIFISDSFIIRLEPIDKHVVCYFVNLFSKYQF